MPKCLLIRDSRHKKKTTFIGGMELVSLRCNRDFTSASSYGLGWYKCAIATQWYQFHTTDAWWFSLMTSPCHCRLSATSFIMCIDLKIDKLRLLLEASPRIGHNILLNMNKICLHSAWLWLVLLWWKKDYIMMYCDLWAISGLILGLRPASERRRYFVTPSVIGWGQA